MEVKVPRCKASTRRDLMSRVPTKTNTDVQSVVIQLMWKGFQCPAKMYQSKAFHRFGHFTSLCYQKQQAPFKSRKPKAHQLQASAVYAKDSGICSQSEDDSSNEDSFSLQVKVKCTQTNLQRISRPTHLITNLAYRLKPHHL